MQANQLECEQLRAEAEIHSSQQKKDKAAITKLEKELGKSEKELGKSEAALKTKTQLLKQSEDLRSELAGKVFEIEQDLIAKSAKLKHAERKLAVRGKSSGKSDGDGVDVPPEFECPISQELMDDPVLCIGDGTTYERSTIEGWFSNNDTSPLTNEPLTPDGKRLIPNLAWKAVDFNSLLNKGKRGSTGDQTDQTIMLQDLLAGKEEELEEKDQEIDMMHSTV